jgi:hypothetical protein
MLRTSLGSGLRFSVRERILLNRQIEVGKTPTTTLGMPRVGRAGLLIRFGKAGG